MKGFLRETEIFVHGVLRHVAIEFEHIRTYGGEDRQTFARDPSRGVRSPVSLDKLTELLERNVFVVLRLRSVKDAERSDVVLRTPKN